MFAEYFTMFAIAMVILTVGDACLASNTNFSNELAPNGRTSFDQGLVNNYAATERMLGPVLGGFIVVIYNIKLLFLILFNSICNNKAL